MRGQGPRFCGRSGPRSAVRPPESGFSRPYRVTAVSRLLCEARCQPPEHQCGSATTGLLTRRSVRRRGKTNSPRRLRDPRSSAVVTRRVRFSVSRVTSPQVAPLRTPDAAPPRRGASLAPTWKLLLPPSQLIAQDDRVGDLLLRLPPLTALPLNREVGLFFRHAEIALQDSLGAFNDLARFEALREL